RILRCKHTQGVRKVETETDVCVNHEWAFSGEREKSSEGVPQGTHTANHNGFRGSKAENRIAWKCMAELGIYCEATARGGRPLASTTGESRFGGKFGSPRRTQILTRE